MTRNPVLKNTLRASALLFAGCASTFLIMREQEKANPPEAPAQTTEQEQASQSGVPAQTMLHSSKGFTMPAEGEDPTFLFTSKSLTVVGLEGLEATPEGSPVYMPSSKSRFMGSLMTPPLAPADEHLDPTYLPSSKFAPLDILDEEEAESAPTYIMGSKSGHITPVDLEDLTPEKPKPRKPKPYLGSSKNSVTLPPGEDFDVEIVDGKTVKIPVVKKPKPRPADDKQP